MLNFDILKKFKILSSVLRNPNTPLCIKHGEHEASFGIQTFASNAGQDCTPKPTYFKQLKEMLSKYWYVVIPIHAMNSAIWFGCCCFISEQGFDVIKNLKQLHIRQEILDRLTHSSMGHLTVSVTLFKLLTPFRFATSLMASTAATRYFAKIGLIKPAREVFKRKKKKRRKH